MHFLTDRTAHTTAIDGPVVDHWLEQKMAQTANASTMQEGACRLTRPLADTNFLHLYI